MNLIQIHSQVLTYLFSEGIMTKVSRCVCVSVCVFSVVTMKPGKLAFVLPVTYQTQSAETGIESFWALYSDANDLRRRWVCALGDHPSLLK